MGLCLVIACPYIGGNEVTFAALIAFDLLMFTLMLMFGLWTYDAP